MGWQFPPYYGKKKSAFYEKKIAKYEKKIGHYQSLIDECKKHLNDGNKA